MTDHLLTIAAAAKRLGMSTAGLQLLVDLDAVPCHEGRVTLRRVRSALMTIATASRVFGYRSRILWVRVEEDKIELADPDKRPMQVTVAGMLKYMKGRSLDTLGRKLYED